MGMLSDLMYQRQDGYEPDQRQRVAEQMLLAQNTAQNTMKPKAYWDFRLKVNDFETPDDQLMQKYKMQQPAPAAPTAPQGQRPQGQVGMTTLSPEKEAILRAQLRELRPHLPQSAYDDMVAAHKAAKGLR